MSKYTAGSWYTYEGIIWAEIDGKEVQLAEVKSTGLNGARFSAIDEALANARLMAAAPAMLNLILKEYALGTISKTRAEEVLDKVRGI